jgi:hypothetical protein
MFGAKSGAHISKGANGGAEVELVFPAIILEELGDNDECYVTYYMHRQELWRYRRKSLYHFDTMV